MMLQFTLKIVEIQCETKDAVTICFKQPVLKKVKYFAGQYLTLVLRIDNRIYHRPYSFSSAPGVDSTLNITVKRVPSGIVSNYLADFLKIGDVVEVLNAMGDFTLENKSISVNSHLIFWGVGSGITPLFSMIKYALNQNLGKQITLVYGNRDPENAIFYQAIYELQKQYAAVFSVLHFHTDSVIDESVTTIFPGRIDPEKVIEIVKSTGDFNNTYHYICGPKGLNDTVNNALQNEGLLPEHIFCENFELIIDPKVFEGITLQRVSLEKAGQTQFVDVARGKTILEAGLDAGIDLSYSCQTGVCLLCKAKLLCGELKSVKNSSDEGILKEGEHLLCCSLPLTNNIKLLVL